MKSERVDVLVVGGGPAGSRCAEAILTEDPTLDVLIVEQRKRVGVPYRDTAAFSVHHAEEAGLNPLPKDVGINDVYGASVFAPNGEELYVELEDQIGWVMDRVRFDQWLSERAMELGAEVREGTSVRFQGQNIVAKVKETNEEYIVDPDVAVFACGPNYALVENAGFYPATPDDYDLHAGMQHTIVSDRWDPRILRLWFGKEVAPDGYAWNFSEGKDRHRVGLGIPRLYADRVNPLLRKFKRYILEADAEVVHKTGGIIPTGRPLKTVVMNGGYGRKHAVVGDAASHTDASTGGGDHTATIIGKALGEFIGKGDVREYQKWYRKTWYKELRRRYMIKRLLYDFSDEHLNRIMEHLIRQEYRSMRDLRAIPELIMRFALTNPWFLRAGLTAWYKYGLRG